MSARLIATKTKTIGALSLRYSGIAVTHKLLVSHATKFVLSECPRKQLTAWLRTLPINIRNTVDSKSIEVIHTTVS